jgi:hypothetical protein
MGVMESIKKGFSVTFGNIPLVAVLFVFGTIWNLVQLKLAPAAATPNTPPSPAAIVAGLVFVLMSIFMQGGSLGMVRDAVKQGKASFSAFGASGSKYYLRLLLTGLIIGIIVGAFVLLAVLVFSVLSQTQMMVATVLAALLGTAGIYVILLLFLAPYIVVSDDAGVGAAIKKSVSTVKHNIFKVLGVALFLVAIGFLLGLLLGVLIGSISLSGQQTVIQITTAVAGSLLGVLVTASFMSLYLGLSSQS